MKPDAAIDKEARHRMLVAKIVSGRAAVATSLVAEVLIAFI
jgi:hypothetical protein